MRKEARKKQVQLRRNFFPTLVVTIFFWGAIAGLVYFIEPDMPFAVPVFFVLTFLAFLFTFSTIFANSRRGLIASLAMTVFLILRYLGIGHIINFLLVLGIATSVELYFYNKAA